MLKKPKQISGTQAAYKGHIITDQGSVRFMTLIPHINTHARTHAKHIQTEEDIPKR